MALLTLLLIRLLWSQKRLFPWSSSILYMFLCSLKKKRHGYHNQKQTEKSKQNLTLPVVVFKRKRFYLLISTKESNSTTTSGLPCPKTNTLQKQHCADEGKLSAEAYPLDIFRSVLWGNGKPVLQSPVTIQSGCPAVLVRLG